MATYVAEAIVLKRRDFGEADRLVTLFTSDLGKVESIAKGVRKAGARLAGQLEPFALASLQLIRGRNFDTVIQAQPIHPHRRISLDLRRTASAAYLSELFDSVLEERAPQANLFALLSAALDALDGSPAEAPLAHGGAPLAPAAEPLSPDPASPQPRDLLPADPERLLGFVEMALLHELGYAPVLGSCAECGGPLPETGVRYSARMGGFLDRGCAGGGGGMAVQPRTVKLLRLLAYRASGEPLLPDGRLALALFSETEMSASVGHELAQALEDTIEYHLDRRLRSLEFLRGLRPPGVSASRVGAFPG